MKRLYITMFFLISSATTVMASTPDAGTSTDVVESVENNPMKWAADLYHAVSEGHWWIAVALVLAVVAFAFRKWKGLITTRFEWLGTKTGSMVMVSLIIILGGLANAFIVGDVGWDTLLTAGKAITLALITTFVPKKK